MRFFHSMKLYDRHFCQPGCVTLFGLKIPVFVTTVWKYERALFFDKKPQLRPFCIEKTTTSTFCIEKKIS